MAARGLGILPITNGHAPKKEEGPRMYQAMLTFTAGEIIPLDLSGETENDIFTNCQSYICDNRANASPIVIAVVGAIVPFIVPAFAWMMGPIVIPLGIPRFKISCAAGITDIPIAFINVPLPAITYTP